MTVTVDIADIKRLEQMAALTDPFVATVAKVVLALLNDRFDAEYRAQMAEIASSNSEAKLGAIQAILGSAEAQTADERLRQIAEML